MYTVSLPVCLFSFNLDVWIDRYNIHPIYLSNKNKCIDRKYLKETLFEEIFNEKKNLFNPKKGIMFKTSSPRFKHEIS